MKRNNRHIKFLCRQLPLLLLLLPLGSCFDPSEQLKPDTPQGNFEALWEIIDTRYCYLDYKGIDWDGVKAVYQPRVDTLKANNYRGLFDLFAQMLDTLQDGHVNLYSDFDVSRCRGWFEDYPANYSSSILYSDRYLGQNYKIAGGLHYGRIADDKVGYIRYNSFSDAFSSNNIAYALMYCADCPGLILDVRDNGGGSLEYARKLAATFFAETATVGYMQHKTGNGHNDFSEMVSMEIDTAMMPHRWLRPVIVLCNRQSYSATNFFVNAMRYAPYSLVVGGITGGGGGMPQSYELPNGWLIRLSSVPMYDREKKHIENGIEPDYAINMTQESMAEGKDDIIEFAVELIEKLTQQPETK